MSDVLQSYQSRARDALRAFVPRATPYTMYGMMRYFIGYSDETFKETDLYGGKHFRPALCLLVADAYGHMQSAIDVANAIELFHNATLVHDDIVDHDEQRRGRPTIWKQWGVPHAINTGDAQLLLVYRALSDAISSAPERGLQAQKFLTEQFISVAEGQYLDFTLADLPLSSEKVTADAYFSMIQKKTATLVGASAKAGGIMSGASTAECEHLYTYGNALGTAFQLHDDFLSLWGKETQTGKVVHGDIREKKKTLPLIYARDTLAPVDRDVLCTLYSSPTNLNDFEVDTIVSLIEKSDAQEYMRALIVKSLTPARAAIDSLSLSTEYKQRLESLLEELVG